MSTLYQLQNLNQISVNKLPSFMIRVLISKLKKIVIKWLGRKAQNHRLLAYFWDSFAINSWLMFINQRIIVTLYIWVVMLKYLELWPKFINSRWKIISKINHLIELRLWGDYCKQWKSYFSRRKTKTLEQKFSKVFAKFLKIVSRTTRN